MWDTLIGWLDEHRPAMLKDKHQAPESLLALVAVSFECEVCTEPGAWQRTEYPADLVPDGPSLGIVLKKAIEDHHQQNKCDHEKAHVVGLAACFHQPHGVDRQLMAVGYPDHLEIQGRMRNPDSGKEMEWLDLESEWVLNPVAPPTDAQRAFGYFQEGQTVFQAGDREAALDHFAQAIAHRADYRLAIYNRGTILKSMARVTEAITHLREAQRLHPFNKAGRLELIDALFMNGDYANAAREAWDSIRIEKNDADYQLAAAKAFGKTGHMERSIQHLHYVIGLEPSHGEAHFILGLAHEHLEEPKKAVKHFKKALASGCDEESAVVCKSRIATHKKSFFSKLFSGEDGQ